MFYIPQCFLIKAGHLFIEFGVHYEFIGTIVLFVPIDRNVLVDRKWRENSKAQQYVLLGQDVRWGREGDFAVIFPDLSVKPHIVCTQFFLSYFWGLYINTLCPQKQYKNRKLKSCFITSTFSSSSSSFFSFCFP